MYVNHTTFSVSGKDTLWIVSSVSVQFRCIAIASNPSTVLICNKSVTIEFYSKSFDGIEEKLRI